MSSKADKVPKPKPIDDGAAGDEEEVDDMSVIWTWATRVVPWRSVLLYGTLIGMTAYIAKLKWRDYTARDLEAAALEKKRDMLQRMRPVPGGRFSMGFVDMQTPLNQHSN
jgi:hypothetical protein